VGVFCAPLPSLFPPFSPDCCVAHRVHRLVPLLLSPLPTPPAQPVLVLLSADAHRSSLTHVPCHLSCAENSVKKQQRFRVWGACLFSLLTPPSGRTLPPSSLTPSRSKGSRKKRLRRGASRSSCGRAAAAPLGPLPCPATPPRQSGDVAEVRRTHVVLLPAKCLAVSPPS